MHQNPRLFLVAHNRNHVKIFTDMARLLEEEGHPIRFVVVEGNPDFDAAQKALGQLGFSPITSGGLARLATPRDVVAVGNDWGPKHFVRKLERLRNRAVPIVGIVEGARFAYPGHWRRVDDLLVWGQSGLDTLPGRKHVVGSPAIEAATKIPRCPKSRVHVVVNYKFMKGAKAVGPRWAAECAAAAAAVDPGYVISAHPFNVAQLRGLNLTHAPFAQLLQEASLLITRSSTVIYEALAAGVQVIYYPLPDERRAEFADPMGAFRTAETPAELAEHVRAHAAEPTFAADAVHAFLRRHVSFNAKKSAPSRMAEFISSKLRERAVIDPAGLPGSKAGFKNLLAWLRWPKATGESAR